ncbi:hypothetical protein FZEAL_7094 [Fusarium zealandicum]|uniref:Pinin/SDK/MemA protein domain-containing protein n=1 Tax=Fusarium zealandicum TaxID=1053134 RepID=A0A8H4UH72_9HYPO|nr:hypothetical protein FZEAL_7094 [Fusarium zealandicum]
MATEAEARPVDDVPSNIDTNLDALPRDSPDYEGLKRKASKDEEEGSPKRIKHDDHFREATNERPRGGSSQSRRGSQGNLASAEADRRKLATHEEKKRGKRLFGGLLNTLSQTTGSTQQKRRLEIERRQQERLQKQTAEDDRAREEKRARLTDSRMGEQLVFQEKVYYLPWKLTEEQENELDDQLRHAKATIERESEAFKAKKERHSRDAGRNRRSTSPEDALAPAREASVDKPRSINGSEHATRAPEREHHHLHHHHHHDESADVLEEAEEDMVIY